MHFIENLLIFVVVLFVFVFFFFIHILSVDFVNVNNLFFFLFSFVLFSIGLYGCVFLCFFSLCYCLFSSFFVLDFCFCYFYRVYHQNQITTYYIDDRHGSEFSDSGNELPNDRNIFMRRNCNRLQQQQGRKPTSDSIFLSLLLLNYSITRDMHPYIA